MTKNETKKTDEELVKLAQGKDKQAEEELLMRYNGLVRRLARQYFLSGGETEDLIQEGMMGLFGAIRDYKVLQDGRSFKNFAYLCVTRRIIDAVKTSKRKKNEPLNYYVSTDETYEFEGVGPEDIVILDDERRELRQRMAKVLSDFEFKIISMYMEGMSCSMICEATGKSSKSVDNALQRSKKKLQAVLKN